MKMAAVAFLFHLTISFALGFQEFSDYQNGSPSRVQQNFSYQRTFQSPHPESGLLLQTLLNACRLRHPYYSTFECAKKLQDIFIQGAKYPRAKLGSKTSEANTINLIPENLNGNKKQTVKPEIYINSILDEDKRDTSHFNTSDEALNSTWIEVKDPRKAETSGKSEIAGEKETNEFISFSKENTVNEEKTNTSIANESENKTNSIATDGSNTDEETTTEIKKTTKMTETRDVETGVIIDKRTTVSEKTSDVTLTDEYTGREITANQDTTLTVATDEENEGNTDVLKKTTGVSSSENAEKSTIADLHTDSIEFEYNVTAENTTVNETDIRVTTEKETEDGSSGTKQNLSTESRSTLTPVVPEDNGTTKATDDSAYSTTVFTTTLTTDPTKSESVFVSDAGISTSSGTESATSSSSVMVPSVSVTGYTSGSSGGDLTSTMTTYSRTSSDHYATKSIPIIPEHVIKIRSIKIAKIVLSVLLLMTGLIAVVMLAVYLFKVRRGAVQYDQLTLLP